MKTQQKFPPGSVLAPLERWCSLDGDADRLMYYYIDTDGLVRLLDGDKIASLSAMFIMDLVKAAGVEIKVGVVQTAYANGNSTSYLTKVLVKPLSSYPFTYKRKFPSHARQQELNISTMKPSIMTVESTLKPTVTAQFFSRHMPYPSSQHTSLNLLPKITPLHPLRQSLISSIKPLVTPFQICSLLKPFSHINPGVQKNGIQLTSIFPIV